MNHFMKEQLGWLVAALLIAGALGAVSLVVRAIELVLIHLGK